jgi:hypothetical protein
MCPFGACAAAAELEVVTGREWPLRGVPPIPDDGMTALRVAYCLVVNKHLE